MSPAIATFDGIVTRVIQLIPIPAKGDYQKSSCRNDIGWARHHSADGWVVTWAEMPPPPLLPQAAPPPPPHLLIQGLELRVWKYGLRV